MRGYLRICPFAYWVDTYLSIFYPAFINFGYPKLPYCGCFILLYCYLMNVNHLQNHSSLSVSWSYLLFKLGTSITYNAWFTQRGLWPLLEVTTLNCNIHSIYTAHYLFVLIFWSKQCAMYTLFKVAFCLCIQINDEMMMTTFTLQMQMQI